MTKHSVKKARERCERIRLGTHASGYTDDATAISVILADNERKTDLLEQAREELCLIRMKDTGVVYNPALRTLIDIALDADSIELPEPAND